MCPLGYDLSQSAFTYMSTESSAPDFPAPHQLGLPEKFPSWRDGQKEAIIHLEQTKDTRFKGIAAPTGFGKSPVYVSYSLRSRKKTCIVTETLGLQNQLKQDFGSLVVDVRGQDNYQCKSRPGWTCEDGGPGRCPYRKSSDCPWSLQVSRAKMARIVVTNYACWIAMNKHSTGLGDTGLLVLDEAHDAPEAVANAMQVRLGFLEMDRVFGKLNLPSQVDDLVAWKVWALRAYGIAKLQLENLNRSISTPDLEYAKKLSRLCKRLAVLATMKTQHWVMEAKDWGFQFDPIDIKIYTEKSLFFGVPDVTLFSATITPKTMAMLGISKDKSLFKEYPSSFPADRFPVYFVPTCRVDNRSESNGQVQQWFIRIDQILSRRGDRKGIIHSGSFRRAESIYRASRYNERFLINSKGGATNEVIEHFLKTSRQGAVLLSPSVTTGYDFPYKACEFQIIGKVPFPDSRSKVMKTRQELDPEYGAYLAMQTLVQASGRGMRAVDDQCEVFILDDHIEWFLGRDNRCGGKYAHLAPSWFRKSYKRVEILPAPPNPLT